MKTIKGFEENIEVSKFGEWVGKNYIDYKFEYENYQRILADYIPKSKIKEFFTSRLEKYQEADDGAYEQDYLTRGELELVDRYKECEEIAKILLEEEIKAEIPQDCIPKSKIREKIEELEEEIKPKQDIHQKLCIEVNKIGTETEYDYAMEELSILDDELREMLIKKRVLQELMEDK